MFSRAQALAAAVLLTSSFGAEGAKPPSSLESIAIISAMPVVEERTGHSSEALSDYIVALKEAVLAKLNAHLELPRLSIAVVVAVKPGRVSRCWIEAGSPGIDALIAEELKSACIGVEPVEVEGGPIAFSLNFKIKRGGKSPNFQGLPYPLPAEWRAALEKSAGGLIPDDALSVVWP